MNVINWGQARCRHLPSKRVTVLLAEDNEGSLFAISEYLQVKGYRVVVARNGSEAIQRAEEDQPDVIVMDVRMPGMDGLEAIRRIRALPSLASPPLAATEGRIEGGPPIIALTALAMPSDRERCLAAGANEYMSKPVRLRNLIQAIEKATGSG
jgi:CheY-like chemotaxis protein